MKTHLITSQVPRTSPGPGVTVIGVLVALWCIAFAVVNIVFEVTDYFARGPLAEYTAGITVMNWLVVGFKTLGAAVALLSVVNIQKLHLPAIMTVLLWGAFATLGLYALGSVTQALGMISGFAGTADQIDLAGIGYVIMFLLAAAGFGFLAVSYSRRYGTRRGYAVLGVVGAPVVLGLILIAVPKLLFTFGLLPAY
ncbi:hypothetical protein [Cytobacillus dafuensis]|uniref:Uncharacterized protein n=1 Tax=Cytobacillus dafuensis TaxID=1742359 RepID=A0A5B8Z8F7_CYTDA|nr:hypothetical protein [Cytobacillus dafuensis]QED47999.1 hypothetical protein FSZ17_12510 [Cytobacillus dafuensis]